MAESFSPTGTTEITGVPNTFAGMQPEPVVAKAPSYSGVMGPAGQSGGNTTAPTQAVDLQAPPVSAMMGSLFDLALPLLKPKLERAKQAAVWEGMQRAAAGESVEQLEAEQNPILKLMGADAPLVDGARFFHSTKTVSDTTANLAGRMGELAGLDGGAASQAMRDTMMQSLEGLDPMTRSMVEAQYSEALPKLLIQHGKERVAFLQEDLLNQQVSASVSAAGAYQAMMPGVSKGTVNSAELKQAENNFLSIFDGVPGVSPAGNHKAQYQALSSMLQNGQVGAYSVAEKHPGFQQLPQAMRDNLRRQELVAADEAVYANFDNPNVALGMRQLELLASTGNLGWEQIDSTFKKLNAENERLTGATSDAFGMKQAVRLLTISQTAAARGSHNLANAQADQDYKVAAIRDHIRAGGNTILDGVVTKPELGEAMDVALQQTLTMPANGARDAKLRQVTATIAANPDAAPTLFSRRLDFTVRKMQGGDVPTQADIEQLKTLAEVGRTENGVLALGNMLGKDQAAFALALGQRQVDYDDRESLRTTLDLVNQQRRATPSDADKESATEWFDDNYANWAQRGLGISGPFDRLSEGAKERVRARFSHDMASVMAAYQISPDQAIDLVAQSALSTGEVVGDLWIEGSPFAKPGSNLLGATKRLLGGVRTLDHDTYTESVFEAGKQRLKEEGKVGDWTPIQGVQTANGHIMMRYLAETGPNAGTVVDSIVSPNAVSAIYREKYKVLERERHRPVYRKGNVGGGFLPGERPGVKPIQNSKGEWVYPD